MHIFTLYTVRLPQHTCQFSLCIVSLWLILFLPECRHRIGKIAYHQYYICVLIAIMFPRVCMYYEYLIHAFGLHKGKNERNSKSNIPTYRGREEYKTNGSLQKRWSKNKKDQ